jgi:hypothetical protein
MDQLRGEDGGESGRSVPNEDREVDAWQHIGDGQVPSRRRFRPSARSVHGGKRALERAQDPPFAAARSPT